MRKLVLSVFVKSRNHLNSNIRWLKESRDNWRRKYRLLKKENEKLKEQLRYLAKPYPETEAIEKLKMELSKEYGWQAFKDKYC